MKNTFLIFKLFVTIFYLSGCTTKINVPAGKIIEYGECAHDMATTEFYEAPELIGGEASMSEDIVITNQTDIIKLKKGVGFGYSWEAKNLPSEFDLVYLIEHPKITDSKGFTITTSKEVMKFHSINGTFNTTDCYFLEREYELIPGTWSITIMVNKNKLVKKSFSVVI